MAVDACVKAILCPLGNAVLSALTGIISSQVVVLQGELISLGATLATLEVQLIPITITQGLANAALGTVTSIGNLVPIRLVANCTDLGDNLQDLNASIENTRARINQILNEANRSLSFKAEIEQQIAAINATIDRLNDLKAAIAECQT